MNSILVTGMHRGGTTVLGKLLASNKDALYIHEPLNFKYGLKDCNYWYTENTTAVSSVLNHSLKFKKNGYSKISLNILSTFIPSQAFFVSLLIRTFFYRTKRKTLIYKDPFASFLSNEFQKNGVKIIFTFKDPFEWSKSVKKQAWNNLPFSSLFKESRNSENIAKYILFLAKDENLDLIFWGIYHEIMFDILINTDCLVLENRTLITKPYSSISELFYYTGLKVDSNVISFIKKNFFSSKKIVKNSKHNHERNLAEIKGNLRLPKFNNELGLHILLKDTYNKIQGLSKRY